MHSNKIAIEKAKKFLQNIDKIKLDKNETWEDECNFSHSNKFYFVFLESKIHSLWSYTGRFFSKRELNKLLKKWFDPSRTFKNEWTSIIIFDVKKNKIVKPHL